MSKYIPLEEVNGILEKYKEKNEHFDDIPQYPLVKAYLQEIEASVKSLKTIDPIEKIDEMIEELEGLQPEQWKLAKKDILQELKSRLSTN